MPGISRFADHLSRVLHRRPLLPAPARITRAMRSLCAGAISFGLVTIPFRVYPATYCPPRRGTTGAMRSLWAGAISFGLVTIPVRLYSPPHPREVAFRQVHREDGGKISFRRVCLDCGREVPYAGVAKGYERPGGDVVMLSDEELASLPRERAHRIEVRSFTRAHEIDPLRQRPGATTTWSSSPTRDRASTLCVLGEALRRAARSRSSR